MNSPLIIFLIDFTDTLLMLRQRVAEINSSLIIFLIDFTETPLMFKTEGSRNKLTSHNISYRLHRHFSHVKTEGS